MRAVSPVIPGVDADEVIYAENQEEYNPLPAVRGDDVAVRERLAKHQPLPAIRVEGPVGAILTRWELDEDEKRQISEQGYIYLAIMTFNELLQPVLLSAYPVAGFEPKAKEVEQ